MMQKNNRHKILVWAAFVAAASLSAGCFDGPAGTTAQDDRAAWDLSLDAAWPSDGAPGIKTPRLLAEAVPADLPATRGDPAGEPVVLPLVYVPPHSEDVYGRLPNNVYLVCHSRDIRQCAQDAREAAGLPALDGKAAADVASLLADTQVLLENLDRAVDPAWETAQGLRSCDVLPWRLQGETGTDTPGLPPRLQGPFDDALDAFAAECARLAEAASASAPHINRPRLADQAVPSIGDLLPSDALDEAQAAVDGTITDVTSSRAGQQGAAVGERAEDEAERTLGPVFPAVSAAHEAVIIIGFWHQTSGALVLLHVEQSGAVGFHIAAALECAWYDRPSCVASSSAGARSTSVSVTASTTAKPQVELEGGELL